MASVFSEPQGLGRQEFIVAVDLDDRDRDARILVAAPLGRAVFTHFAAQLVRAESSRVEHARGAVLARRTVTLGSLVLDEKPLAEIPAEAARAAMLRGVRELGDRAHSPGIATRATCRRAWNSCAPRWAEESPAGPRRTMRRWDSPEAGSPRGWTGSRGGSTWRGSA